MTKIDKKDAGAECQNKVIALDAMGGDVGPKVTVPAALQILVDSFCRSAMDM